MSHSEQLSNFILWSDLKLLHFKKVGKTQTLAVCYKMSEFEVCPRCAQKSSSIYDRRWVTIKDAPIRGKKLVLRIQKRRLYCSNCKKPFTEPVNGIWPGRRTTQRYRREILWACQNFTSISRVQNMFRCSAGFVYRVFYEQLEGRLKNKLNYPWPKVIGIDEHFFSRTNKEGRFATVLTDIKNRRLREVVHGKDKVSLWSALSEIPGRENVDWVAMDLADSYKYFTREFFPNAKLVADKFHVLRLLHPAINQRRKQITGDKRSHPTRKLLLRNGYKLGYFEKQALWQWLEHHPELKEVYGWKEKMHAFYRIKGRNRAREALIKITETMRLSALPEIQRLSRTLTKWRKEILNHFYFGLTNAMTEGFNRIASLVKNTAFGYRSFTNYRLRLLNACS